MSLLVQYLRCNVVWRAAQCLLSLALIFNTSRQAKVADLHVKLIVEKEIAELEIAMNDVMIVKIFDSLHDLMHVVAALVLSYSLASLVEFLSMRSDMNETFNRATLESRV